MYSPCERGRRRVGRSVGCRRARVVRQRRSSRGKHSVNATRSAASQPTRARRTHGGVRDEEASLWECDRVSGRTGALGGRASVARATHLSHCTITHANGLDGLHGEEPRSRTGRGRAWRVIRRWLGGVRASEQLKRAVRVSARSSEAIAAVREERVSREFRRDDGAASSEHNDKTSQDWRLVLLKKCIANASERFAFQGKRGEGNEAFGVEEGRRWRIRQKRDRPPAHSVPPLTASSPPAPAPTRARTAPPTASTRAPDRFQHPQP